MGDQQGEEGDWEIVVAKEEGFAKELEEGRPRNEGEEVEGTEEEGEGAGEEGEGAQEEG